MIQLLLESNGRIDVVNVRGFTAIEIAALARPAEIIQILLDHGADAH